MKRGLKLLGLAAAAALLTSTPAPVNAAHVKNDDTFIVKYVYDCHAFDAVAVTIFYHGRIQITMSDGESGGLGDTSPWFFYNGGDQSYLKETWYDHNRMNGDIVTVAIYGPGEVLTSRAWCRTP